MIVDVHGAKAACARMSICVVPTGLFHALFPLRAYPAACAGSSCAATPKAGL